MLEIFFEKERELRIVGACELTEDKVGDDRQPFHLHVHGFVDSKLAAGRAARLRTRLR